MALNRDIKKNRSGPVDVMVNVVKDRFISTCTYIVCMNLRGFLSSVSWYIYVSDMKSQMIADKNISSTSSGGRWTNIYLKSQLPPVAV